MPRRQTSILLTTRQWVSLRRKSIANAIRLYEAADKKVPKVWHEELAIIEETLKKERIKL